MVNTRRPILAAISVCLAPVLFAQSPPGIERRVAELEEKMRLIDPAFGKETSGQDLLTRLDQLEKKLNGILAATEPQPATAVAGPVVPPQGPALTPVSVTGDYQASPTGETKVPL